VAALLINKQDHDKGSIAHMSQVWGPRGGRGRDLEGTEDPCWEDDTFPASCSAPLVPTLKPAASAMSRDCFPELEKFAANSVLV
jgi:hypothetical protein